MFGNVVNFCMRFAPYLVKQIKEQQLQKQAAALTYMTMFAVVPLMTVTYSLFSLVPAFEGVETSIQTWMFKTFVPEVGQAAESYLSTFSSQARNLTGAGVILLFASAFVMLRNIERTFNGIWGVSEGRKGLHGFLLYWAILSLGPLLVGAGIVMGTYVLSLKLLTGQELIEGFVPALLSYLPWLLTTGAFTLLYAAVPNCNVPIKHALAGGLVTAISFELAKDLFGWVIGQTSLQLVYGAFALVPLFLIWINLLWLIVLAGAILVRVLSTYKTVALGRDYPDFIAALLALWQLKSGQQGGTSCSDSEMVKADMQTTQWQRLRDRFVKHKLIVVTQDNTYVLSKDLDTLSLRELADIVEMESLLPGASEYLQEFQWFPEIAARLLEIEQHSEQQFALTVGDLFRFESNVDRELSEEEQEELEAALSGDEDGEAGGEGSGEASDTESDGANGEQTLRVTQEMVPPVTEELPSLDITGQRESKC